MVHSKIQSRSEFRLVIVGTSHIGQKVYNHIRETVNTE